MKKILSLIAALLLFTACATITVEKEDCKASYTAVGKSFDGIAIEACDATGNAQNVNVDDAIANLLNRLTTR